jgi:hypothetical protein
VGEIMPKERVSEVIAYFKADVKTVWDVVTNNSDYSWRSDIEKIEIKDNGNEFIEYTPNGNATHFYIVKKNEYSEYAFDIENKMFSGKWTGCFYSTETGGTKIVFTEKILIKNPIIRLLSYVLMDLKKIQEKYVSDLKKKLGE